MSSMDADYFLFFICIKIDFGNILIHVEALQYCYKGGLV